MLTERDLTRSAETGCSMGGPHEYKTSFAATELAVRDVLVNVGAFLQDARIEEAQIGQVEIVLAEALNNVVEHAYVHRDEGLIELRIKRAQTTIDITILDTGVPVPVHVFAKREGPQVDVALDDLPEGGFGWMLIQRISTNLSYQRVGDTNCLRISVPAST